MNSLLAKDTGSALVWRALQLTGTKLLFLVRTLILARLLLPQDFGLLAISLLSVDFLINITELGMVPALVQIKEVDNKKYHSAWTIGILRAIIISTFVFLAAPYISSLFAEPRATPFIRVVALRPIIEALASIKMAELIRQLRFKSLMTLKLSEAFSSTITAILLAPSLGVWALIIGALAGPMVATLISYGLAPFRPRIFLHMQDAKPLIHFGRWVFLTSIISITGSLLIQMVISRRLGAAELGLYYLAAKLAFIPFELSNEVIGGVTFPLFSRLQSNLQQAARAFRSIITGMVALVFPLSILMIVLAPPLVDHVLGIKWEGTVPLIQVMATVNIIGVFGVAAIPFLKGIGRPDRVMIIELIQVFLISVLIWWLADSFGVVGAAFAWLPAVLASQFAGIFFMKPYFPHPLSGLGKTITLFLLVSIIGSMIALAIIQVLPGLGGLIMSVLVSLITFVLLIFAIERWFSLGLIHDLTLAYPQVAALVGISREDQVY